MLVAVELSASRSQATTVTLSSHQNTATSGTDFTAGPYTVFIPAGQTRGTVSIQTTQDNVLEGDEDFDVSITGASPATTVSSRGRATITIEDDEYQIGLGSVTHIVDENAGVFRLPVTLSKALRKDVLIDFTYTDWTAMAFVHYTPVHASQHGQPPLRIPAGQTNAVLEIPIHDNTSFDTNKLLQITAVNPGLPDGETDTSTQFIIRNIDELIFPSSITAVAGRTLRVAVERNRLGTVPVTFDIAFPDPGAAADFGAGPHRVTIPAGRFRESVHIPVTADADTTVENIRVEFEIEGSLIDHTTATIYPVSNVVPTVSITADSAQVVEGGTANFTVTASPAPPVDMDVQVRYFVNGGAFLDMEEEVQPAEEVAVTIPGNGRTGSVAIQTMVDPSNASGVIHAVLLDRHDTPNGSGVYPYRVRGKESVASDGTPIGGSAASIAVTDGPDVPELKVKLLRFSPDTVEEGTDLDFYLNVNFAPDSDLPVNLSIREGPGTFAPGGDYVAADTWTATIPAGERGVAFSIPTVDDGVEEPNAIVRVRIESGTGYTVSNIKLWDVTVTDDGPEGLGSEQDGAQGGATPLPVVTIVADAASVTEGGDVTFTVTADPAPSYDLPVNVGVAQEMGAGGNRVGSSWFDMVTIRAGESSAIWTVTTMSDDVARADGEAVGRILWGNDYRTGATSKVTVALIDDDGGTADTDGAPEPTSVTTQTGPPGVPLALVAEVKGHIAHFKARNHGAGVRDWTLVLDRLEGRTGMNDAAIAAWLARSRLHGWQDGIQTLPKVQAALAALAAVPQQQPATLPVVTIAAGDAVTEGGDAVFTLTASPLPASPLSVSVTVAASGDYGIAGASRTVTIPTAGSVTLTLATADDAADEPDGSVTVTVNDGDGYTVGSSASGTVSVQDDDLPPPAVSITAAAASVTEGGAASFTLTADRAPDADLTVTLAVTEAADGDHVAADDEGTATVTIAKGATEASFSVPTVNDAVDEPDGSVTVTVNDGAGYTVSSSPGDAATVSVSDNDAAATGPVLSVADATVTEGDWAELMPFAVRLSAAAAKRVRVRASTRVSSPVSARPKEDYWPQSELVTFYPGETEKTVWVYIYNDSHDEDPETFEVVLSDADGATIGDGVAVGTIVNDDPMPAAWLARFGRTVAEQALDGIAGRMAAPRMAGMQGTLAGQSLSFDAPANDNASGTGVPVGTGSLALADVARRFDNRPDRFGNGGFGNAPGSLSGADGAGFGNGTQSRTMTARDALLGSSFSLTGETDGSGGSMAFWGRAAQGSFDGREGTFSLDGAVTTGMLGADYARGKWLVGLALAQSAGEGDYRDSDVSPRPDSQTCPAGAEDGHPCNGAVRAGDGSVEASLTTAIPYAALQASERLKLWGAAGYGTGEVTLKTAMGGSYKADTSWSMAAAGLRGDLLEAPAEGSGPALALTSDALWTRTSSEKTRDLAASDSDATRLRLGLEGSYRMALEGGGHLTPRLEVGARHDGGDAETGFGVELGGGIAWVDPGLGLSLDVSGRTLIAHGDDDLKDRGYAASLAFDPDPATQRGPSLSLRQEFGGQAKGGLDALFQPAALEDRTGGEVTSRWSMEAAYGVPAFGGRFTGSPHVGLGLATGTRDYSVGWRLTPEAASAPDLSFGLKATRRKSDAAAPEHTVGVEATMRW